MLPLQEAPRDRRVRPRRYGGSGGQHLTIARQFATANRPMRFGGAQDRSATMPRAMAEQVTLQFPDAAFSVLRLAELADKLKRAEELRAELDASVRVAPPHGATRAPNRVERP